MCCPETQSWTVWTQETKNNFPHRSLDLTFELKRPTSSPLPECVCVCVFAYSSPIHVFLQFLCTCVFMCPPHTHTYCSSESWGPALWAELIRTHRKEKGLQLFARMQTASLLHIHLVKFLYWIRIAAVIGWHSVEVSLCKWCLTGRMKVDSGGSSSVSARKRRGI